MNKSSPKRANDFSRYMRGFCHSMRHRGLVNFVHDITFGHGEISMLMADTEMFHFYCDNKIPVVFTDDSGRTLSNGIYINQILEKQHSEYAIFMKFLRNVAHKLKLNYGQNSLHYVVNQEDCQHMYSIFFDLSHEDFLHFVINNGSFIRDMIDEYNFTSKDIILEAATKENSVILPSATDFILSHDPKSNLFFSDNICVIHKNTGLPIHLSPQRSQCLLHLTQGKSAKEIAKEMQLSTKTIEHYLDMLRKELGCRSSKELIIFYAHQLT